MTDAWLLTRVEDNWSIGVVNSPDQAVALIREISYKFITVEISVFYNQETLGQETIYLDKGLRKFGRNARIREWYDITVRNEADKYRLTKIHSYL